MPSDLQQGALSDILHHIDLAETFAKGQTFESFRDDVMRLYAVTRCLEIISEASRRLPDTLKGRHRGIAWKDMAGAGNIYRHNYEDVVARRVWDTIQIALPPLRAAIAQELSAGGRQEAD